MTITLFIRITGVIIIRIGGRCTSGAVRAFVLGVRFVATVVALIVCLVSAVRVVGPPPRRWRGWENQGTGRLSFEEGRYERMVFGAILVEGLFSFRCVRAVVLWIESRLLKRS